MIDVRTNKVVIDDNTAEFVPALVTGRWLAADGQASVPAARAGYGIFYVLESDGKPYFRASDGTVYNMGMIGGNPMVFKGSIATNVQFPLIADVQTGWLYKVTADVRDNAGVTYTNTGQMFTAGAEIAWNGTDWSDMGTSVALVTVVATPYVVADVARVIAVNTATIAAPSVITLPTAVGRDGKRLVITDSTGSALAYPISVTPNGAETINGINAPYIINQPYQTVEIVSTGTAWVTLQNEQLVVNPNFVLAVATPYVVTNYVKVVGVDTVTIGAPSVVTLPTAVGRTGRRLVVTDATGSAILYPISVTPNGGEFINGVNTAYVINQPYQSVELVSTGTTWVTLQNEQLSTNLNLITVAATPHVIANLTKVAAVDTVTIAAPSVITLPTAVGRTGRRLVVTDATGSALAYPISVTPNGGEFINGVNTAYVINQPYQTVELVSTGTGWVTLQNEQIAVNTNLVTAVATPHTVANLTKVVAVDTVTIGAPSVVALPTAVGRTGRRLVVTDSTGSALAYPVSVTPNGGEFINGVNAPFVLNQPYQTVELVSTGTTWVTLQNEQLVVNHNFVLAAATPYVVTNIVKVVGVDTATIGAPSVVTLPTAVGRTGKRLVVTDATGEAMDHPISVTPNGGEFINGVNAAMILNKPYETVELVSTGTAWVTLQNEQAVVNANIVATIPGIAFETLGNKGSAALNGSASKFFIPESIEVIATAVGVGVQNGDAQIIVGTSDGGTQITTAHPVPITVLNGVATILLEGGFAPIAGNATLWAQVSTADTSGTADLTATVRICGRQV